MKLRRPALLTTLLLATSAFGAIPTTTISTNDGIWNDNGDDYISCELNYTNTHLALPKSVSFGKNTEVDIYWSTNNEEDYYFSGNGTISADAVNWHMDYGTFIFSNSKTLAGGDNNILSGDIVILDTKASFNLIVNVDTLTIWEPKVKIEYIDSIRELSCPNSITSQLEDSGFGELSTKNIGNLIGGAEYIKADVLVNGMGPDQASTWISQWYDYRTPEISGKVTFKSKTPVYYALDYYFS